MKIPPVLLVPALALAAAPQGASGQVDSIADRHGDPVQPVRPAPEARRATTHAAPRTRTERSLARLWAQILSVEGVGRGDRFCSLGGHSLTAAQLVLRIESAFGIRLEPAVLLADPSLAELASEIDRRRSGR
jgi:acyl carrier protein